MISKLANTRKNSRNTPGIFLDPRNANICIASDFHERRRRRKRTSLLSTVHASNGVAVDKRRGNKRINRQRSYREKNSFVYRALDCDPDRSDAKRFHQPRPPSPPGRAARIMKILKLPAEKLTLSGNSGHSSPRFRAGPRESSRESFTGGGSRSIRSGTEGSSLKDLARYFSVQLSMSLQPHWDIIGDTSPCRILVCTRRSFRYKDTTLRSFSSRILFSAP